MAAPGSLASRFSKPWVAGTLVASVCYLSVLSLLNARGVLTASPALLGVTEFLIYGACLVALRRSIGSVTVIVACVMVGWLCIAWAIRGEIDLKSARDLVIPLLFLTLGRHVADRAFADRVLWLILMIVLAFALYEAAFLESYARLFNTYGFYVNTGATTDSNAMFDDQMLTLNGFRPDGIGRTLLPQLLGQHRVSSLLMEPVSLGNFALLMLAWGVSRPLHDGAVRWRFVIGAMVLIVLADSRFALMMSVPVVMFSTLPAHVWNRLSLTFPFLGMLLLVVVANWLPSYGDTLAGRLTHSGEALQELSPAMWFGVARDIPGFWDMGYAYVLSRFGILLFGLLLACLMLLPLRDAAAVRFRSFVLLYGSAILLVSGTSFFALKTAAPLWFAFGVLSAGVAAAPRRTGQVTAPPAWTAALQPARSAS